jgi:hypothetical protein
VDAVALCGAAIVMILSQRVPWSVLNEDHPVAVLHHDATLLTSEKLVHHLQGRNHVMLMEAGRANATGASRSVLGRTELVKARVWQA